MTKPAYLQHVGTRDRGARSSRSGRSSEVVLLPTGQDMVPTAARQRLGLPNVAPDGIVELGSVVLLAPDPLLGRRHDRTGSWCFTRPGQPDGSVVGRYDRRSEAVESCAVDAIDGPAARARFDDRRWQRRRPCDN